MVAKNDVTGDSISTKSNSKKFVDNWDRIFGKKQDSDTPKEDQPHSEEKEDKAS